MSTSAARWKTSARRTSGCPVYCKAPIRHKSIICSPLLGPIDLRPYLSGSMEEVVVGGESGEEARVCDYSWVLDLRQQCVEAGVPFHFMQTRRAAAQGRKVLPHPKKAPAQPGAGGGDRFLPRRGKEPSLAAGEREMEREE